MDGAHDTAAPRVVADIGLGLRSDERGQALRVEKIANNPIRSEDRAGVRFISVSVSSLGCGNNTDNLTIHERSQFIDRIVTLFVSLDEHPRRA